MLTFKEGDLVKYRSSFLRNCGWYTNVPTDGKVTKVADGLVYVHWCTREDAIPVNASNIMLASEPDYS